MELETRQGEFAPLGTYTRHVRLTQDISGRPRQPQHNIPPPLPSVSLLSMSSCSPTSTEKPRGFSVYPEDPRVLNQTSPAILNTISSPSSWPQPPRFTYDLPQDTTETQPKSGMLCCGVEEGLVGVVPFRYPSSAQLGLELRRRTKRIRTSDDVDGPGTAALPCKKRRLLLHLVTSRLSRPFSLPATHILIRESGDNMPVLHRIQQLTALGARRAAGHQGALLVRKAAILNRIRIGVRQAAVSRGHTVMADLARRYNALNHGLLLVTTPASATFPVANAPIIVQGQRMVPPVWRPHTTSFHPPTDHGRHQYYTNQYHYQHQNYHHRHHSNQQQEYHGYNVSSGAASQPRHDIHACSNMNITQTHLSRTHKQPAEATPLEQLGHQYPESREHNSCPSSVATPPPPTDVISDDEDNTAFPAASFHDRYADLSDDDMDDVYADFGVLFGSGARSPDRGAAGSTVEEQFYEEYLDELDGIPWVV